MDRVRDVCIEMLEERGYVKNEISDCVMLFTKQNAQLVIVFMYAIEKLNVNKLKEYISIMKINDVTHSIIIYSNKVTSKTNQLIDKEYTNLTIELFKESELQFNILKSNLVPKHTKVSDDYGKELKAKFGNKFPIIRITDAVCKFYNFKRGDIIEINGCNNYIYYRIVK